MGKKRKAGDRPLGQPGPRDIDEADAKLRINTYEDVADSEDEFHINRDKILLGEDSQQRKRRRLQEEEEFLEHSDEEVLADALSPSEADDLDDGFEELEYPTASGPKRARKPLGPDESDQSGEEEEDLGDWGTSKRDYYNADTIETEADALEEEAEARRLQQKRLEGLTELDFGVDGDNAWLDSSKDGREAEGAGRDHVIQEVLPQLEITDAMSPDERMKIMKTRYPEFEPLAAEYLELQSLHEALGLFAAAADAVNNHKTFIKHSADGRTSSHSTRRNIPIAVIKYSALTAYLASLCMYFALLTSPAVGPDGKTLAMSPAELRNHTVMESLVKCRKLWGKVKDLRIPEMSEISPILGSLDNGEVEHQRDEAIVKALEESTDSRLVAVKRKKNRKSKAQRAAEAALLEAEARRAERLRKTEEDLAELAMLTKDITGAPRKPEKLLFTADDPSANDEDDSDLGEQTTLTAHEAAEKAKRKKSLRFYTSQIAQKANKRGAAGRDAGGDADLPYRERLKDRVARLNAEAEARGKKPKDAPGEQLGGESDEEDRRAARALREEGNANEDDYYDMVATTSKKKKADKKALAAAQSLAAKEGGTVHVVEEVGPDGKRAITYAIEKNKGLAPKRKKDVRNPRVKKRKKFEEKKKKLGSTRAVYMGGEGRGGYAGERTGIKKGLVKSVKL